MTQPTMSRTGWRLLTRELTRHRTALGCLAAWSVVESLPALLSGLAVAAALDRGFLAGKPLVGLAWLGLLAAAMVMQALATRNTFPWLASIVEPVRDALVRTVVTGALCGAVYGGEHRDSAAVARLSGQTETVRNLVSALLRTLRPSLASLALALIGLVALAPAVAAVTLPLIVVSLVLFGWLTRVLAARQRVVILAEETMTREATEIFDGIRDVVAAGADDQARDTVERSIRAKARASLVMARTASARSLITAIGSTVPVVLILLLAPWLLRSGRLTPGELVGAVTYLVSTLGPALRSLTGTVAAWIRQLGVLLHRIAETSAGVAPSAGAGTARPDSASLTATGLTFAYGPHAEPVVDGFTMHIPAGEHLAVVGPSGIGKSTLACLLAGIADPQAGTVRLGGVPLADVDPAYLRRSVALIPQEAYVFTASVRENLEYLRPGAARAGLDRPGLDRAVAALGMRALLDRLGGYDAALGVGGAALSAGERQLIALARVYLSPATVVVLDEATCHLDPIAEARAEHAFAATGRTLVVVAHRISSARRARRILLLDGTSAVLGSHEELLAAAPRYADLVGHWSHRPAPALTGDRGL
jgi:ATP-binding cassette subfamily C protein